MTLLVTSAASREGSWGTERDGVERGVSFHFFFFFLLLKYKTCISPICSTITVINNRSQSINKIENTAVGGTVKAT